MREFEGTIKLEDGDGLATSLLVDDGRLRVTAGEHEIGNWAINELSAVHRNGEFRLSVEDDELVVGVNDPAGLSEALGIKDQKGKQRRGKKPRTEKRLKRSKASPTEKTSPVPTPVVEAPVPKMEATPVPAADAEQTGEPVPSLWTRLSRRTKVIGAVAVGLLILGVINPSLLAALLLLAGLAMLFLAIAAKGEGGTTGFHPPAFFATDLAVGVGFGMVLIAILIMVIS